MRSLHQAVAINEVKKDSPSSSLQANINVKLNHVTFTVLYPWIAHGLSFMNGSVYVCVGGDGDWGGCLCTVTKE